MMANVSYWMYETNKMTIYLDLYHCVTTMCVSVLIQYRWDQEQAALQLNSGTSKVDNNRGTWKSKEEIPGTEVNQGQADERLVQICDILPNIQIYSKKIITFLLLFSSERDELSMALQN